MIYCTSYTLWLKNLISLANSLWANWWPFRSFKWTFLLSRSGKAKFSPGVQLIWRLVNCVMITWYRKNRWDNLLFRARKYNSGLWSQKILIACGEPMMKCSWVCRADMIPKSSRCKVDIFFSSFVNTRELKETIGFSLGNSCTMIDPVPILDESTWICNGYLGFGIARIVSSLILS